jgi:hypothetical protein
MSPENGRGRDGGDRATPDTTNRPNSIAPAESAAINLRAWLIGFALNVQRADVAIIALALAGWPR